MPQPDRTGPARENNFCLEVRYTDASRTVFEIVASAYRVQGNLSSPHTLIDHQSLQSWLSFRANINGHEYSSALNPDPTRINLYRRGPWFCEVHWLDVQMADKAGNILPLKGDVVLYCYPEKLLASVTWHALMSIEPFKLLIQGRAHQELSVSALEKEQRWIHPFALFGETDPLPADSLRAIDSATPLVYDPVKGSYTIGSHVDGSFQKNFYEFPNRYEQVSFALHNDAYPRKIYICHESVTGGGTVEGGVVLNARGEVLPITVQISKNFSGEKEEKFYNPGDTPFSETYFPVYLEPYERIELTSLHLYQNWGRHMTKHWSSLGAWMDYFHSSTGVTETTCYVPFKFAHLPGISIADFRAMSQKTFWAGQPQHDNVAGHAFLSYFDGKAWQYLLYRGTRYKSTGPNWFDIGLEYLSSDSAVAVTADIWETPQEDELRSFFKVTYCILKPLTITRARRNFRFLSVTSRIQSLRYTHIAASSLHDTPIDYTRTPFLIEGHPLGTENSWVAEYGDLKGSNAIMIRRFIAPDSMRPAFSFQVGPYKNRFDDRPQDSRLMIVPECDSLSLKPGDEFIIDGFWLPYGETDGSHTPRQESAVYSKDIVQLYVQYGKKLSDLPAILEAKHDSADFMLQGGRNIMPVVIKGLRDPWNLHLFCKRGTVWHPVRLAHNTDHDGEQIFFESGSRYGKVFLVRGHPEPQHYRLLRAVPPGMRLALSIPDSLQNSVEFKIGRAPWRFQFHEVQDSMTVFSWNRSEGPSWWFHARGEAQQMGGRMTPVESELYWNYWWQNDTDPGMSEAPLFELTLLRGQIQCSDIYLSIHGKPLSLAEFGLTLPCSVPVDSLRSQTYLLQRPLDSFPDKVDFGWVGLRQGDRFLSIGMAGVKVIHLSSTGVGLELAKQNLEHRIWQGNDRVQSKRRAFYRGHLHVLHDLAGEWQRIQSDLGMPVTESDRTTARGTGDHPDGLNRKKTGHFR